MRLEYIACVLFKCTAAKLSGPFDIVQDFQSVAPRDCAEQHGGDDNGDACKADEPDLAIVIEPCRGSCPGLFPIQHVSSAVGRAARHPWDGDQSNH